MILFIIFIVSIKALFIIIYTFCLRTQSSLQKKTIMKEMNTTINLLCFSKFASNQSNIANIKHFAHNSFP